MSTPIKIVTAIAVLALIVGGYAMFNESTNTTVVKEVPGLGAVSGPDISSPYLAVNGSTIFYNGPRMNSGTTSVCEVKSPGATSTLIHATAVWSNSTTSNLMVEMGKGSTPGSTSTRLTLETVIGGQQLDLVATGTGATFNADNLVFGPNQYFNVRIGGGTSANSVGPGTTMTGHCNANFLVL